MQLRSRREVHRPREFRASVNQVAGAEGGPFQMLSQVLKC
jgi:hypothetical protein